MLIPSMVTQLEGAFSMTIDSDRQVNFLFPHPFCVRTF